MGEYFHVLVEYIFTYTLSRTKTLSCM